jgi:hypothetical protein
LVERGLKQTGARWQVKNVDEMAELSGLTYSNRWDFYWAAANSLLESVGAPPQIANRSLG